MNRVSTQTGRMSRSARTGTRATVALGSALRTAALAAGGAAAAYISIAQARQAITTTQELALATSGLNRNLGLATTEASKWAAVTRARGIDSKTLTMSFTSLSRAIEGTKTGTESAVRPFRDLGITQKELAATGGNFSKQVLLIADALGQAEGSSTRQAAAAKLLGRGYRDLLPMFSEGAKGLQEQLKWADEFGATMGQGTVDAMKDFTTAQRRGKVAIMGLQIAFAKFATPAITEVIDGLGDLAAVLNDPSLTKAQKLTRLRQEFESLQARVISVINDLVPIVAQSAGEIGVALAKGIGQGFLQTGLLGKVAIGTALIRMFGGPAAIMAAGASARGLWERGMTAKTANVNAYKNARSLGYGRVETFKAMGMGAAAGFASGFAKFGMIGTGIFVADQLIQSIVNRVQRGSPDIIQALEAIANKPFLEDKLNTIVEGLDLTFTGSMDMSEENAQNVVASLKEITTADRERFRYLSRNIRERVRELDLTREQKKAIKEIIATSKVGSQNARGQRFDQGIRTIQSGALLGEDLQAVVDRQLREISDTYNRYTPRWREKVESTLNAQIEATRDAYSKNGRLTEEGMRRIQAIIARRARLLASGDPVGIARGIANGWRRAGTVNGAGIKRFIGRLAQMPPAARRQAGATMVAYARELEKKGQLPDGTVAKLRSKLIRRFGPELWNKVKTQTDQGLRGVGASTEKTGNKFDDLADKAVRANRRIKASVASVPGPVKSAYGRLASYANSTAEAFGSSQRVSLNFRKGGGVRGRGMVTAAVSPGELISYKGREIYVPGRPEPRDSVLMNLPVGAKVFTRDGQRRLAMGASETEALRRQAPHFAKGGIVGSDAPRPRLTGGARVPRATGQAAIDRGRKQAEAWISQLKPTLRSMEVLAGKFGLQMTSGYRPGDDGYHGVNRARDFSNSDGPTPEMMRFAKFVGTRFGSQLLELIYSPLGWSIKNGAQTAPYAVEDHYDHVHVALRKGGVVPSFRGGGWVKTGFTVFDDPGGGYAGHLQKGRGYAELGTATSGGSATGMGYIAQALGMPGELRDKFPLEVKINGRTRKMYKRDRGYGQGTSAYSIDIYKDSWRYFGLDGNSKGVAYVRPAATKEQIEAVKKSAGKVAGRIQKSGQNRGARGYLRAAKRNVQKARRMASRGNIWDAGDRLDKARTQIGLANKNRRKKGGGNNDGKDGRRPPTIAGTVGSLLKMAGTKGISRDTREALLSSALSIAQGTEGTTDDLAVLGAQKRFQKGIQKNAKARLRTATNKLRSEGLSPKERRKWKGVRNDALQNLGASASEIATINADIKEAKGGGDTAADLAEAMKELADAIKEQNEIAQGVQATSSREALRMLSDVISGQIVGKRVAPSTTPQGVRY